MGYLSDLLSPELPLPGFDPCRLAASSRLPLIASAASLVCAPPKPPAPTLAGVGSVLAQMMGLVADDMGRKLDAAARAALRAAHRQAVRTYVRNVGVSLVSGKQMLSRDCSAENALLAGAMLEAYVDGTVSEELQKRIAAAIAGSADYQGLVSWLSNQVQREALRVKRLPNAGEVQAVLKARLKVARKDPKEGGVSFYFGDEGMQPIIGGVGPIILASFRVVRIRRSATKADEAELDYAGAVTFSDTYDFANNRTSQAQYDAFRKLLAALLLADDIVAFEAIYWRAQTEPASLGLRLDRGHIFASYMYAVERAGYFKGVSWSVTVPFAATVKYPSEDPGEGFEFSPKKSL